MFSAVIQMYFRYMLKSWIYLLSCGKTGPMEKEYVTAVMFICLCFFDLVVEGIWEFLKIPVFD